MLRISSELFNSYPSQSLIKSIFRGTKQVPLVDAVESYVARNRGPDEARKVVAQCKRLEEARHEITVMNFSDNAYMLKDTLIFYYNGLKYLEANFPFEGEEDD